MKEKRFYQRRKPLKLYNISLNNLKRRKGKAFFPIMGIFTGVLVVVALISIAKGMYRDIEERLDRFGANIVMTPKSDHLSLSYGGVTVGNVSYQTAEFDESSLSAVKEIKNSKNIGIIAPKVLGSVKIDNRDVLLMGVDYEAELSLKTWWNLMGPQPDGNMPQKPDDLIVGAHAADILFLKAGDPLEIKGERFHIAAVLAPTGGPEDSVIIGPMKTVQKVLNKTGKVSLVEIAAFCRGCPISEMVLQIAEKFPGANVTAMQQAMASKMQSVDMIQSFSMGVAVLVIAIGSLLVFITMMGSVNERTREIGIFRAIGFRRGHIMQIVLLEAMIMGFIGGITGFIGGMGLSAVVMTKIIPEAGMPAMDYSLLSAVVLLSTAISLIASLYPARKAGKLDPSEALRAL